MSQVAQVLPIQYDAADVSLGQIISGKTELNTGYFGKGHPVELLPVQPWNFTLPLNASVIRAQKLGASKIVFLGLEMTVLNDELNQILSLWSRGMWHKSFFKCEILMRVLETLVIGKALSPHSFKGNRKCGDNQVTKAHQYVVLTGLTSPWNTFAVWDLAKLAKVANNFA